jgi:hypothetical protein
MAATTTTLETQLPLIHIPDHNHITTAATNQHNSNRTLSSISERLHHRSRTRHLPTNTSSHNSRRSRIQTWLLTPVEQHHNLARLIKSRRPLSSSAKCQVRNTLHSPLPPTRRKHPHQLSQMSRVQAFTTGIAVQHSHPNPPCNGPPASPRSHRSQHLHNSTRAPRHSKHHYPHPPSLQLHGKTHLIPHSNRQPRRRNKRLHCNKRPRRNSNSSLHRNNNNNNNNNSSSSSGSSPSSSNKVLRPGNQRPTPQAATAQRAFPRRHRISCPYSRKSSTSR